MAFIDNQLVIFKNMIEESIKTGGVKGKESMIRSSQLINLIHDAVKYELIQLGVARNQIFPRFGDKKTRDKACWISETERSGCLCCSLKYS